MMKKLFTLLLAAVCFTASAQIDIDGDSYSEVFFGDLDNADGQYIRCIKD